MLWELSGQGEGRRRRARRLIAFAFIVLANYVTVQSSLVLAVGYHPKQTVIGHRLDRGHGCRQVRSRSSEARTGNALDNSVLTTEGRVTFIDGLLAVCVAPSSGLTIGSGRREPARERRELGVR